MRTFYRTLRTLSVITLFFFCWTFMPLWQAVAWATEQKQGQGSGGKGPGKQERENQGQGARVQGHGERFEKALEHIRDKAGRVHEKHSRGEDTKAEIDAIKAKKAELETIDSELKTEFAATEKKLKDAKLPKEILDRHKKFVKHYEDNLKELKTNLDDVDKAKTSSARAAKMQKVREHLEKVKAPKRHKALDPHNLPHRTVKAKKEKAPRLKKEEFEKEFPPQRSRRSPRTASFSHELTSPIRAFEDRLRDANVNSALNNKPIMVAANGSLAGLLSSSPEFKTQSMPFSVNSVSSVANGVIPQFIIAQAIPAPSAEDLSETPEVQFTPEIRALAAQLEHNPVKIYNWVRNNIEFVPTYGSIQGAQMTLETKMGNAFDTASLLIALLRASNIYAHYVYGTIEIPIEKAMNWVGGVTDPKMAGTIIATNGIPGKSLVSGGAIKAMQLEHVWVEGWIDYIPSRGAVHKQGDTWIPMDGSYKQYSYTAGFDMTTTVPFSQDTYLSQVQSQNPLHYYQSQIQGYLDANMPDKGIVDVKGYREIQTKLYDFLPGSLQYKVVVAGGDFSAVPENKKAKVTFSLSDPVTGSDVSYSASTHELAGKRITISYVPATSADEALINNYGGFLYNVPAYMLHLKPVLKVEGVISLTGEAITLGSEQSLTMQFSQPGGNNEAINKKLIAGAYYAIGMNLQGINENVLGKRNYQNNTNVLSETAGTLGKDDLIGEHLFILMTLYHLANDKTYKSGAKLYNTVVIRTPSEGIAAFTLSVDYMFSMPRSAMPSGINIDVAMDRVIVVAKDGNTANEKKFMDLAGLVSSYHEHDIFERIDNFSSVSAVRALQVAITNGIPIQRVTSSNISQVLPVLQVDGAVKADIQNAVNAGKEVTIPQMDVQINDWRGIGYIVKEPVSGSGAYMISGGLAGGDTTSNQDGMRIVEIHKEPLGWIKDKIDLQIRSFIVTAAQLASGEYVPESKKYVGGMSYTDIGQCVGLVRAAYWMAGICLDMWSPSERQPEGVGSCAQYNLVDKHKISGENGVSYHYNLANHLQILKGVRKTNDPLIGDMVFFDNTYDKNKDCKGNDERTHVGIVETAPGGDGTITFIHASGKNGVVHGKPMNITSGHTSDWKINTFLRDSWENADTDCTEEQWDSVPKLSGQLFSGFGTVRDVACTDSTHK